MVLTIFPGSLPIWRQDVLSNSVFPSTIQSWRSWPAAVFSTHEKKVGFGASCGLTLLLIAMPVKEARFLPCRQGVCVMRYYRSHNVLN